MTPIQFGYRLVEIHTVLLRIRKPRKCSLSFRELMVPMAKTQQDTRVADWLNCEPNSVTKGTMYQKEIYGKQFNIVVSSSRRY